MQNLTYPQVVHTDAQNPVGYCQNFAIHPTFAHLILTERNTTTFNVYKHLAFFPPIIFTRVVQRISTYQPNPER